jgi:serine phosphatase RsbU (regulator of sigma subunit)
MLETGQKSKTEQVSSSQPTTLFGGRGTLSERRLYFIAVGFASGAALLATLLILVNASRSNTALYLWLQVAAALLVLVFSVATDQLTVKSSFLTRNWTLGAALVAAVVIFCSVVAGEYLTVLLTPLVVDLAQRRREQHALIMIALGAIVLITVEHVTLTLTGWSSDTTDKDQGAIAAIIVIITISLSLGALIRKYRNEISSYQKEQETKASEMEVAHEIQSSLMPPSEIVTGTWSLAAKSIPARDVGGDFYEYIPHLDQGIGGVAIGDVAGKGIPAALQMAVVRTLFRVEARRRIFPAETLMSVNMALQAERSFGMVTLLYGFVDQSSSTLHLSNAGHNYPIILNGTLHEVRMPGLPLGIDDGIEYEEKQVYIAPGTSIIFYTDGVIEAMNSEGELYGFPRLRDAVIKNQNSAPREMVDLILSEVATFAEGAPQSDDITVVVIQHHRDDAGTKDTNSTNNSKAVETSREKVTVGGADDDFEEGNWI